MKRIKQLPVIFIFVFTAIEFAAAQAPNGMNYQAIARDAGGNLLGMQNICIQSTITDGNGGTVLYQETFNTTTNQFGLFTLSIGNGTPVSGTFASINWGAVTAWQKIEIKINCTGSYVLMGSAQLLSVPYSLNSAKSATTSSVSGTTNYLSKFTGASTIGNSLIYESAGSLGVGTTSPLSLFHVLHSGTTNAGLFQISNASNNAYALQGNSNGTGSSIYGLNTGTGRAGFFEIQNASSSSNAIFGLTNGSGYAVDGYSSGTGSAGYFEINNAASSASALVGSTGGSGNSVAGVNFGTGASVSGYTTGTGNAGYFQINNASNSVNALSGVTNGSGVSVSGFTSGTGRAGSFFISNASSSAEAIYGQTNGSGNSIFGYNTGTGSPGFFQLNNTSSSAHALFTTTNSNTGSAGYFRNTSTGPSLVTDGGFVGIGTTTPSELLHIMNGDVLIESNPGLDKITLSQGSLLTDNTSGGTSRYLTSIDGSLYWATGKTLTLDNDYHISNFLNSRYYDLTVLNSNGYVGLGTSSPGAKLEVNGQVKITGGSPATGSVLTSTDGTGLATWQPPAYPNINKIDTLLSFAGYAGASIAGSGSAFVFVGPTVSYTITSTSQKVKGSAVASLGLSSGGPQLFDICLCSQLGAGTITEFAGASNYLTAAATTNYTIFPAATLVKNLTPGTYNFGYCVKNPGALALDHNDWVNGWIEVTDR